MKAIRLLLFGLLSSSPLFAHPHMLIHTQCTLEFDQNKVTGLWVQFEFDRFFSGEIIWGYDEDGDGVFNEKETAELNEYVFSNFQEFNYFTFLRIGMERIMPNTVEDFTARCEGQEVLFFRFFIPLPDFPYRDFHIAIYDSSFFCACRLNQENPDGLVTEEFFTTSGTGIPEVSVTVEKNTDFPVYYNPQGASTDKTLYDSWKPGLQTFYPEEIHVQF